MTNSIEYVRSICKLQKISISKLEKDCGFSNGYLNPKKISKLPYDRAVKIANYLNIDVKNILDASLEANSSELTAKDEYDIAKDVNNIMNKLTSGEDGPASFDGEPLSPESAELFREELQIALKRLKIINKEKYNPNKYK